ncbi:MAG: SurA N-terminal domain-containing protein, partial [Verrucomicrobia bacterium]|nr:SurA N-terminal domain-containing protein [Verrucomicrobiota bacterium]
MEGMHVRRQFLESWRTRLLALCLGWGGIAVFGQDTPSATPGRSTVGPSVPVTGVAAVVNSHVITVKSVEEYAARAIEAARRQFMARPDQFYQRRQEIMRDSLEQLVERYLILDEFSTAGYNMPEGIINDWVDEQTRRMFGDRLTLMKTLRQVGESYQDYWNEQRDSFIISQITVKNVNQNVFISPRKIERYYELNTNKFNVEETAHVRMIVIDKSRHALGEPMKIAG